MRTLRKLLLGETWSLPLGVAAALAVTALLRVADGPHGWFHRAGGWVLFGCLVVALAVALGRPPRSRA